MEELEEEEEESSEEDDDNIEVDVNGDILIFRT